MVRAIDTAKYRRYRRPVSPESRAAITDGYLKVVRYAAEINGKKEASVKHTIVYVGLDVADSH